MHADALGCNNLWKALLGMRQPFSPTIFQWRNIILLFEHGGKLALIAVADLFGDFRYG